MDVAQALTTRRSTRAFLPRGVPRDQIARLLTLAAQAPSGNNTQPWQVDVLTGAALHRLGAALLAERHARAPLPPPEYNYYPAEWPEPHLARRRANGWALYNLIGVQRGDRAGAMAHHDRNFTFFGAPVGLILSIDRRLGQGALIDAGLFLQSLTLAAQAEGLATCLQAAFTPHHKTIRSHLQLTPHLVCGVALGHPDSDAVINRLVPPREPVEAFARFHEG
jgi:nitroreductase